MVINIFILFVFQRHFYHCTGHIMRGSFVGRGNQHIQLVKVLYCKLPTISEKLPSFPHRVRGLNHRPQRWETSVLPLWPLNYDSQVLNINNICIIQFVKVLTGYFSFATSYVSSLPAAQLFIVKSTEVSEISEGVQKSSPVSLCWTALIERLRTLFFTPANIKEVL